MFNKPTNVDLQVERDAATFDLRELSSFLYGGAEIVERKAELTRLVEVS